jgi:hypothetical protein
MGQWSSSPSDGLVAFGEVPGSPRSATVLLLIHPLPSPHGSVMKTRLPVQPGEGTSPNHQPRGEESCSNGSIGRYIGRSGKGDRGHCKNLGFEVAEPDGGGTGA